MNELTLLIRSQFSLRFNCFEIFWLYIDNSRLQGIPQNFYCTYPKNSLSWEFSISIMNMVSYDLLLFMLKIETSARGTNSMPFLVSRRGSFAVQFGDHLRSGHHLQRICGLGIICSAFAVWASFAALYRPSKKNTPKAS